jgi:hypothetical protein
MSHGPLSRNLCPAGVLSKNGTDITRGDFAGAQAHQYAPLLPNFYVDRFISIVFYLPEFNSVNFQSLIKNYTPVVSLIYAFGFWVISAGSSTHQANRRCATRSLLYVCRKFWSSWRRARFLEPALGTTHGRGSERKVHDSVA